MSTGFSLVQSLFFLSTALVGEGHFHHASLSMGENAFDSIFKCDALVHHCAQCLAIDQSHFLSMKLAFFRANYIVGIYLINSTIG